MTVLHAGNYKDDGVREPPANITVEATADLGACAATYEVLFRAGAATADSILVTPLPNCDDNDSDAQARKFAVAPEKYPEGLLRTPRFCAVEGLELAITSKNMIAPQGSTT